MITTLIRIFIICGLLLFVGFVLLACLILESEADEKKRKYWEKRKQDETTRESMS